VFIDSNLDGIQDPDEVGAEGVTVKATDGAGVVETVTTDVDGVYELLTDADDLRIEFSGFPEGTSMGRVSGTSGPATRFLDVDSDRDDVNLALASPQLFTTQFFYEHALDGINAGEGAVISVPYLSEDVTTPTVLATVEQVGSVWGLAYQASSESVFASSFLKRHAGLGPNAAGTGTTTGGIYRINRSADPVTVSLLIDLNTAGAAFLTGLDPHPAVSDSNGGDWFTDAATLPLIGKRGLGGMQLSEDGRTLYVMNLNFRSLVEIPLNANGTRDLTRSLRSTQIPLLNPDNFTGFDTDDLRPFAVAVKGNAVFVGVTYTAESTQFANQLRSYVYAFDPAQGAFRTYNRITGSFAQGGNATPVVTANLTYARGVADDPDPDTAGDEVSANWQPWTPGFDTALGQEGFPVHPEPWLTDIVFDGDAMVLGLRDRFGDQGGFQTGNGTVGNTDPFAVIAVGDILRAGPSGSSWQLEANGAAGGVTTGGAGTNVGPGSGEFYFEDAAEPAPAEVTSGALAFVPGFNTVVSTGTDPLSSFSGGFYSFFNSDTDPSAAVNTAGTTFKLSQAYESFDQNTFGSANGLGDLEAIPAIGSVELGNRVFEDTDNDGAQDPGEPGIAGVTVLLFRGATQVDSIVTDDEGDFLFEDLLPNTAYEVRINTSQTAVAGRALAPANLNRGEEIDSDATLTGSVAIASVTTGSAGSAIHSLDIGFAAAAAVGNLTLGDLVFRDANNDGIFNTGDTPIPGVLVELLDDTGTATGDQDTTDANGLYSFANIAADTYRIRLAASNFTTGNVLFGFTSSGTTSSDPNDNIDNDDNGLQNGQLGNGGVIVSGPITLADGTEPINDGDTNNNTNLSLDFGLVPPPAANVLSLGNLVFRDTNNDGLFGIGETGIDGVVVELLDADSIPILGQTTTTAGGGLYTFTGLATGSYRVRLVATNFTTGVLAGFTSSTTDSNDPNDNVNNDDNGVPLGTLGTDGVVMSSLISLADGTEPINDGDTNNNSNLTLDFGMVPAAATGSLTVGDRVWNDTNNNGVFDTGETGINGVAVQLISSTGTVVQNTSTLNGGLYSFSNVAPGDYRVRLPATNFTTPGVLIGFTSSTNAVADPDDNVNDNDDGMVNGTLGGTGFIQSGIFTLVAGGEPINDGDTDNTTNLTIDFGVVQPTAGTLTLGDAVFRDVNNNGLLDGSETGVGGVTVQLLNNADVVINTAMTDSAGIYKFTNLPAGSYRVRLPDVNFLTGGPLAAFTSSTGTANAFEGANTPGPDTDTNNDDNGTTTGTLGQAGSFVQSGLITLVAANEPVNDGDTDNTTNLSLDFGMVPPVQSTTLTIGNTVWHDVNNNGLLDGAETGIQGVFVQLLNGAGSILQQTTSLAGGVYTFANLTAGTYKIRLSAANFTGTGVLVGFTSSTGTNGSATGAFEGSGAPSPDGNVNNDDNGSVSGTLGAGGFIETGTMALALGAEPVDDGDTNSSTNLTMDLGVYRRFSVGNSVFNDLDNDGTQDANETGVSGVVVRLLNASLANALVSTQTTNASGQYLFNNLAAGSYVVELASTNFNAGGALFAFQSSIGAANAFEPPTTPVDKQDHGKTVGTLGSGGTIQTDPVTIGPGMPTGENPNNDPNTPDNQSNLRIDFGVFQAVPAQGRISGRVFLDYNNSGTVNGPDTGLQGVTVTLTGGSLSAPLTVQTDALGNYSFNNLAAGTYTVTETQPTTPANQTGKDTAGTAGGTTTTPNVISGVTITATQNATGYNFGEVPLRSTGGFVYEDLNGNGTRDANEGIQGVTVTLTGTSAVTGAITPRTATTDATGAYTFTNVTPGNYTIAETQPSGYIDGAEQNGTPAAATVTNDRFAGIDLTASAATSGNFNFREVRAATIAGIVYNDANNDGIKAETGEDGIVGVKLTLTGTNDLGQAINLSATSGTGGAYSFTGLRPGTYKIVETQPLAYRDGKETVGTSGGNAIARNDEISAIVLGSGASATGYLFGEQTTADLVMTQTPTRTSIRPGGTVTMTYTVRNTGNAAAAGVEVAVNYGGLVFVSTASSAFNSTTKKWTVGALAAGATQTIQIVFRAPNRATYTPSSTATTTSIERSTTNNRAAGKIFAGTTSTPTPTPTPTTPRPIPQLWFLSSSTNARKTPLY
jgi:hypothetical protein